MGIGSSLKKAIKKIVPKELGDVAQVAAFIPGPHQAVAAGLAALGGYRDEGFKGALKKGLGSYMGGQFTSGLARGSQFGPDWMQSGFGSGEGSGFARLDWIGGQAHGMGEGVGSRFFGPTKRTGAEVFEEVSGVTEGTFNKGVIENPDGTTDLFYREGDPRIGSKLPGAAEEMGKQVEKKIVEKGLGESIGDIFRQGFNKETTANLVQAALSKEGLPITLGAAAALVQYLENKAMEKNKIDLQVGAEPGYMTADRGTSPVFTNPNLSIGQYVKDGGIIGLAYGGEPTHEMDYRPGGFIPVGAQERADDVPARLSKNEFVMTADAVRAAGGGSVDVGAQRMYNLMNQLEGVA